MKKNTAVGVESQAARWIAERDRAGNAWLAERQEALDAWLNESTSHRVAFLRLDSAWMRADRLRALRAPLTLPKKGRPIRPDGQMSCPKHALWTVYRAWSAGVVACFVLAIASYIAVTGVARGAEQRYATEHGGHESIGLTDGSHVTLNTDSLLRTAVTNQKRDVWLDRGEAFFQVAHDASRPFIVHVGNKRVTVLGTKFSVHRDGDDVRVEVEEGRVQVDSGDGRSIVLARNDAALAVTNNVIIKHQTDQQTSAALSWTEGKLVFDRMTLRDAAQQFNRYNRKKLVIDDEHAAQITIGGVFEVNNVDAFVRLLQAGFGLRVRIDDGEIHVSSGDR